MVHIQRGGLLTPGEAGLSHAEYEKAHSTQRNNLKEMGRGGGQAQTDIDGEVRHVQQRLEVILIRNKSDRVSYA